MNAKIIAKLNEPDINASMLIRKDGQEYQTKVVPNEGENPADWTWANVWINHTPADVRRMLVEHFGKSYSEANAIMAL